MDVVGVDGRSRGRWTPVHCVYTREAAKRTTMEDAARGETDGTVSDSGRTLIDGKRYVLRQRTAR